MVYAAGFISCLIYSVPFKFDILRILELENLVENKDRYGLTEVNGCDCNEDGIIYKGKHFLYNPFFSNDMDQQGDDKPIISKIIFEQIHDCRIAFRLDYTLSVPIDLYKPKILTFELFRGRSVNLSKINSEVFTKEIEVIWSPTSENKLLIVIRKDQKVNVDFFHVVIEQLPCPTDDASYVNTKIIHAEFLPDRGDFRHFDVSVNAYDRSFYHDKYADSPNITGTYIDAYTKYHYKLFCVENGTITKQQWYQLTYLSLNEQYRELLSEAFESQIL